MSNRNGFLGALVIAVLIVAAATAVQAVYYDITGYNALLKGRADIRGNVAGIGTNAVSGFLRASSDKTAGYSCTATDAGKVFTNTGATGTVRFTLPNATSAGLELTYSNANGYTMEVDPYGTGQILKWTNAAGDRLRSTTTGSAITLISAGSNKWTALQTGTDFADAD